MRQPNTKISRAKEDRNAACPELSITSAHFLRIRFRDGLLVVSVGGTDNLWQVVLSQSVV